MRRWWIAVGLLATCLLAWGVAVLMRNRKLRREAEILLSARQEVAKVLDLQKQRATLDVKVAASAAKVAELDKGIAEARREAVAVATRGPRTVEEVEDGFARRGF